MMSHARLGLTGATVRRDDRVRGDPVLLGERIAHPDAAMLRLDGIDPVLDGDRLMRDALTVRDASRLIHLGDEGAARAPLFAAVPDGGAARRIDGRSRTAMGVIGRLPNAEAAVYAAARTLVDWHARHLFCGGCGQPTVATSAGWSRQCQACNADHYPRIEPVAIMLPVRGDMALVARQPRFPPRVMSALAGFVEAGESLEETVVREVSEEAGLTVTSVAYVASQPWPFPASLMLGCIATVADGPVTLDRTELEQAVWISRTEARAGLAGDPAAPFAAPPPLAIAHHLLATWAGSDEA